jgi:hypothetical protein
MIFIKKIYFLTILFYSYIFTIFTINVQPIEIDVYSGDEATNFFIEVFNEYYKTSNINWLTKVTPSSYLHKI